MKKIALVLSVMFIALHVSAQDIKIIPRIGMNIANVTNSDANSKVGLNVGVSAEWMWSEKFGIEPGIYYSMQGAKADGESLDLDYINIPMYVKYYIMGGFNAFAGPQLGFNVRAKAAGESISNAVKTADFGMGLGLGYQFQMGLNVAANYTFGFIDILKGGIGSGKNGVFQINVGWRF